MDEEAAFVAAILANPDDDTPRLVFADWLDDRGDPRGELLRVATELERLEAAGPPPGVPARLARVRRIGELTRRWRKVIRPTYRPWLAQFHRGQVRCSWVLGGRCPGRWDRLEPEADRPFSRHCRVCGRWVRLCWTRQSVEQVQATGGTVALAVVRAAE